MIFVVQTGLHACHRQGQHYVVMVKSWIVSIEAEHAPAGGAEQFLRVIPAGKSVEVIAFYTAKPRGNLLAPAGYAFGMVANHDVKGGFGTEGMDIACKRVVRHYMVVCPSLVQLTATNLSAFDHYA